MLWNSVCGALILLVSVVSAARHERSFPNGFLWSVSTSAYQIEGGWNEDGKGESIWDKYSHEMPSRIIDNSTGDVAADSYHQWRRDIEILLELNVSMYRMSISWARIMPTGLKNEINEKGLEYYNNIFNELLRVNITPIVTLYHWDLPQRLQELGGWTNDLIVGHFKDYAELVFDRFADRVQWWTTFNEPYHACLEGYDKNYMAPGYSFPGVPSYLCGHNMLKSHGTVVDLYRRKGYEGKIGITADCFWYEPKTSSSADAAAVETAYQFYLGWFMHPIFSSEGNYPPVMIDRIEKFSKKQGLSQSRLPKFTAKEIKLIKGSADFFGFNFYTSLRVTHNDVRNSANHSVPSWEHDSGLVIDQDPTWKIANSWWFADRPRGIYHALKWIDARYNRPYILITENGYSGKPGLNDVERTKYHVNILNGVLDAIEEGVNVGGYTAWSLIDSMEWSAGYTANFGLYHVDFNSPERTRTAKLSAKVFSRISKLNRINFDYSELSREFAAKSHAGGVSGYLGLVVSIVGVLCVSMH